MSKKFGFMHDNSPKTKNCFMLKVPIDLELSEVNFSKIKTEPEKSLKSYQKCFKKSKIILKLKLNILFFHVLAPPSSASLNCHQLLNNDPLESPTAAVTSTNIKKIAKEEITKLKTEPLDSSSLSTSQHTSFQVSWNLDFVLLYHTFNY